MLTAGTSDSGVAATRYDLEEKFKQLDMENYDNDDDNLIARMLQVCTRLEYMHRLPMR
jgi:hypothetical protein